MANKVGSIEIAHYEKIKPTTRQYHFTINDIHRCAIARDLIIFMLIDKLSGFPKDSSEATNVLNAIYFIYLGVMMPKCAFDVLQMTIEEAVSRLKVHEQPVKWLYLQTQDISQYIDALTIWQGKDILETFTNAKVIRQATRQIARDLMPGYAQSHHGSVDWKEISMWRLLF